MSLTPLKNTDIKHNRISYDRRGYSVCVSAPSPESWPEFTDGPQQEQGEDDDDFLQRRLIWLGESRIVLKPEPGPFAPPPASKSVVDIRRDYVDGGLQVIVKLENIHLTPEKPVYEGKSWHVEGQLVSFKLDNYGLSSVTLMYWH
jgi:hypothetical protein